MLKCGLCNVELVNKKVSFIYLDYKISEEVPCCPKCGQVYLSEEIVKSRVARLEQLLEEK